MRSFKIYGKWSVQASIHTHVRNEVALVWGLAQARPNECIQIFHEDRACEVQWRLDCQSAVSATRSKDN